MADYAAAMDVKEDVEEEGAGHSDPTLSGDMTGIRKIGSHCFSVFVAASFLDTQMEREALVQQVSHPFIDARVHFRVRTRREGGARAAGENPLMDASLH